MSAASPLSGVRAMVLAAGAGTRLRPLTHAIPKPMVPVAGTPVLHHCLENLARHGVKNVMLNLWAFPEQVIRSCGDGSRWGLTLSYSIERTLLGTAGAVKKCEAFFKGGPVLLLSGDGMSDVDLTAFAAFHQRRGSFGTMVVKRIEARYPYGVALTSRNGRIRGFLEKPSFGDFFSNQVNTGIYLFQPEVFRHIPKGFYDFGSQLWPKLLAKGALLHAWEWSGYWCDVGDLEEYRRSQLAALRQDVRCSLQGRKIRKGVWIGTNAQIGRRVKIEAPCLVGAGARIADGAVLGPETVIGAGARVGTRSVLKKCILFDNTVVGAGAHLVNCIIGEGGVVKAGAVSYNATVLKFRQ